MLIGATIFPTDETIGIIELARALEDRGFDSLWVPEHTHIPLSRETPWPMVDGELPRYYKRSLDPFVAMAAAVSVTSRLRVATGVCLVNQHDPIGLAKQVASVDHLSGGRLLAFGVGYGWNVDEMRGHGIDPARKRTLLREKVELMKALWTEEEASYSGTMVSLAPSWQWPKPVQQPHPPIMIGGGKAVLAEVVRWADGWAPIEGPMPVLKLKVRMAAMAEEVGRDPSTIAVHVSYATPTHENLDTYVDAGIDGVAFQLPAAGAEVVLPLLDRLAPLVERYSPATRP